MRVCVCMYVLLLLLLLLLLARAIKSGEDEEGKRLGVCFGIANVIFFPVK